ncbi:MAG: succinate dehydrogenase, hydrophobic membrane anchor protein [Hyphomicrobiaceae bacterium]
MNMRTPLKNVYKLGSAKEGADHFWQQRVSAVANVFLGLWLVWLIASLAGSDHAAFKQAVGHPLVALGLLLLVLSGTFHMRLGMQTIIEDYFSSEVRKIVLLMLNTFFAIAIGLASTFAILKLSFGS